ncbi:MAG: DUF4157 domain-containing protein [Cyanobacteria bacterium P01_F01_bin.86]
MTREAAVQTQPARTNHPLYQGSILQRKCTSCGQHKAGGGTCAKCQAKDSAKVPQTLPLIQTKLTVGQPNDKYEKEADRVAEQVMRMPAPATATTVETQFQPPKIQRICANCEDEEKLQAKEVPGGVPEVTPAITSRIQSLQGGGQPLPASTRNFFEPRFGQDLSHVRIHSDSASTRDLSARAYTVGHNIVFDVGQYTSETSAGRNLLAHELTHVIQQQGVNPKAIQRSPTCENDPSTIPPEGIDCPIAHSSPSGSGLDVFFNIEDSTLSTGNVAAIHNLVRNWHAAGGAAQIRVDGFASCDGPPSLNWRLSCNRALAVAHELLHPSDPTLTGVAPSYVETFANGETTRFSSSPPSNRRTTVSLPTPTPTPTPIPTPTPTPTPTRVIPCTPMPRQIFNRGRCGGGTDFTHHDFQSLSGVSATRQTAVWEADHLTFDFQLRNRMRLELGGLAGTEGFRMVSHFASGTGTQLTHGSSSTLGRDALSSGTVSRLNRDVTQEIERQLASMDALGVIDCNAITLPTAAVPSVSFGFSDGFALKGIIGGTQGLRIRITHFSVTPGTRHYQIGLQYLICDDFGVDTADLYSPGLIAFWVLQHRRTGHRPFINELDLPMTNTGTY